MVARVREFAVEYTAATGLQQLEYPIGKSGVEQVGRWMGKYVEGWIEKLGSGSLS